MHTADRRRECHGRYARQVRGRDGRTAARCGPGNNRAWSGPRHCPAASRWRSDRNAPSHRSCHGGSRMTGTLAGLSLVVRKAGMRDIHPVLRLINAYASKGVMLPRTEFDMSENIRDFSVVYAGDRLAGCGALHFYTPTTAEVRSLAVDPELKTQGIGRVIVE